jgi:hypothetical protein
VKVTGAVKVAVTLLAASVVTTQLPVPVQAPDQPVKVELPVGAAVNVTVDPMLNEKEQVAPQLIPAGSEVTVPVPVPSLTTKRAKVLRVKPALTDLAASIVTTQVPVPVQPPPDQPVKFASAEGEAVKVTIAPLSKENRQVAPQAIPAGEELTVPLPDPFLFTVSAKVWMPKLAETDRSVFMARSQRFPVVLSHPDQPVKVAPLAGAAVSLTAVPMVKVAEQTVPFAPQLIPSTSLVTVPFPAVVTKRVKVFNANVAVTFFAASIVKMQLPVPEQAPDHPVKVEFAAGAAVRVT